MRPSDYQLEERVKIWTVRCQWLEQRKELTWAASAVTSGSERSLSSISYGFSTKLARWATLRMRATP